MNYIETMIIRNNSVVLTGKTGRLFVRYNMKLPMFFVLTHDLFT